MLTVITGMCFFFDQGNSVITCVTPQGDIQKSSAVSTRHYSSPRPHSVTSVLGCRIRLPLTLAATRVYMRLVAKLRPPLTLMSSMQGVAPDKRAVHQLNAIRHSMLNAIRHSMLNTIRHSCNGCTRKGVHDQVHVPFLCIATPEMACNVQHGAAHSADAQLVCLRPCLAYS